MTAQEKWVMTLKCMQLVRVNHALLLRERKLRMGRRQRHVRLMKWLEAIEAVQAELKKRSGKSAARARHDWLLARAIEIMVFRGELDLDMRTDLAGPRPLSKKYVDSLAEAAVRAIEAKAEEMGLLGQAGAGQKRSVSSEGNVV